MEQLLWRHDITLYQPVHTEASFHVLAYISHMNDGVTDGKLEILAYVRIEALDIHLLDSLVFLHFTVETHGFRPTPVQGIAGTQRTLSYYRMRDQVGFLLKFTIPLHFDLIARSR